MDGCNLRSGVFIADGYCVLHFDTQQREGTVRSVDSILEEMQQIEQNCAAPNLSETSLSEFYRQKSRHHNYFGDVRRRRTRLMDVAPLLANGLGTACTVSIPVENAELGGDPVLNVLKRLELTYTHGGLTYRKRSARTRKAVNSRVPRYCTSSPISLY